MFFSYPIAVFFGLFICAALGGKEVSLTPPLLNPENFAQRITCIRPVRNGGIRLEAEMTKEQQLVIHDYGHGSAGWTNLPASVDLSLTILKAELKLHPQFTQTKQVSVLGAGCIGLLTAIRLQEAGYEVTIIADQIENLTSHNAGGTFNILFGNVDEKDKDKILQLGIDSFRYYRRQTQTSQPEFPGVSILPLYAVNYEATGFGNYPLVEAGLMPPAEDVTINFGNGTTYKAQRFETIFMHTNLLMEAFWKRIQDLKIPVLRQKISNWSEVKTEIIFNCTGLGGRDLGDPQVIPAQGHLFVLKDEPLGRLQYIVSVVQTKNDKREVIYWIPKGNGVLGGTYLEGEGGFDTNQEEFDKLIERAKEFFGPLST